MGLGLTLVAMLTLADPLAAVPERAVALDLSAKPLWRLMPELSGLMGATIEVAPALKDRIAMVVCPPRPSREILREVAAILEAKWEPTPAGARLVPNPAATRERVRKERSAFVERVRLHVQTLQESLRRYPRFDAKAVKTLLDEDEKRDSDEEPTGTQGRTPDDRLLARVARFIPLQEFPLELDDLPLVMSTRPTPSQRALPAQVLQAAKQYMEEETALIRLGPEPAGEEVKGEEGPPEEPSRPVTGVLSKVIIRSGDTPTGIDVILVDTGGWAFASTTIMFPDEEFPEPEPRKGAFEPGPLATEWIDGYRALRDSREKPPAAFLARVLRPDLSDPLEGVPTDVIRQVARADRRPIVAVFSDMALLAADAIARRERTFDQVLLACGIEIKPGTGEWRRGVPIERDASMPRRLLRDALRDAAQARDVPIRQQIETASPSIFSMVGLRTVASLVTVPELPSSWDHQVARIFRSLSPAQVEMAKREGLSARSLTPEALRFLGEFVLSGPFAAAPDPNRRPPLQQLGDLYEEEVTEYVWSVVDSGLRVTESSEMVVALPRVGLASGGFARLQTLNALQLGRRMAREGDPVDLSRLRVGTKRRVTLTVLSPPYGISSASLQEVSMGDRETTYDQLPADFRAEAERAKVRTGSPR